MPGLFPFVGKQIGLVCSDSVRYEGRLVHVDSNGRSISLTNGAGNNSSVVHFGTEDRLSSQKEVSKGALRPDAVLTFPDKYVKCYWLGAGFWRPHVVTTPPEVITISDDEEEVKDISSQSGDYPPGVEPVTALARPTMNEPPLPLQPHRMEIIGEADHRDRNYQYSSLPAGTKCLEAPAAQIVPNSSGVPAIAAPMPICLRFPFPPPPLPRQRLCSEAPLFSCQRSFVAPGTPGNSQRSMAKTKVMDYTELGRIIGLIGPANLTRTTASMPTSSISSSAEIATTRKEVETCLAKTDSTSDLRSNSSFSSRPLPSSASRTSARTPDTPPGNSSSTLTAMSTTSSSSTTTRPFPLYFIAQICPPWAIGILLNADVCPTAPTYIRFDTSRLPTTKASEVTLSQVWRVYRYVWSCGRTRRQQVNYHYRSEAEAMSMEAIVRIHGGTPWLVDGYIHSQADVGYTLGGKAAADLVEDAVKVHQEGRLVQIINGATLDIITYLVIESTHSGFVRLGPLQRGLKSEVPELVAIREGMHISAESIRLPTGCRIGRTFILPAGITYHRDKGPFEPDPKDLVGISRHGEFLMC